MIDLVLSLVSDPKFWFVSVAAGIVVNLVSNFLYDHVFRPLLNTARFRALASRTAHAFRELLRRVAQVTGRAGGRVGEAGERALQATGSAILDSIRSAPYVLSVLIKCAFIVLIVRSVFPWDRQARFQGNTADDWASPLLHGDWIDDQLVEQRLDALVQLGPAAVGQLKQVALRRASSGVGTGAVRALHKVSGRVQQPVALALLEIAGAVWHGETATSRACPGVSKVAERALLDLGPNSFRSKDPTPFSQAAPGIWVYMALLLAEDKSEVGREAMSNLGEGVRKGWRFCTWEGNTRAAEALASIEEGHHEAGVLLLAAAKEMLRDRRDERDRPDERQFRRVLETGRGLGRDGVPALRAFVQEPISALDRFMMDRWPAVAEPPDAATDLAYLAAKELRDLGDAGRSAGPDLARLWQLAGTPERENVAYTGMKAVGHRFAREDLENESPRGILQERRVMKDKDLRAAFRARCEGIANRLRESRTEERLGESPLRRLCRSLGTPW